MIAKPPVYATWAPLVSFGIAPAAPEPYYREALEGKRRVLGDDHRNTLTSMNNMGALLRSMGKHAEAEPYYREALKGFRRVLGDDHPETLASIGNMGNLLEPMGRLGEAELYCREALDGRRRVLGDDHPDTLASINSMGVLLRELARLDEAQVLLAEAVAGARRSLPKGHRDTGEFLRSYGRCLTKLKRFGEAETALLEAFEILRSALSAEHQRTVKVVQSLVDLYTAWHAAEPDQGYDAQAAAWRAKLEEEGTEARRHEGAGAADDTARFAAGDTGCDARAMMLPAAAAPFASEKMPGRMNRMQRIMGIDVSRRRLAEFCRRHRIRKLAFFGSVLREDFGPDSDVDVLIEFQPGAAVGLFQLAGMELELSDVLGGRKVDLNTPRCLGRYVRDEVVAQARVAYAEP